MTVRFGDFVGTQLREEAARQGVSIEGLVAHALVYYLANADAGCVSWRVPDWSGPRSHRGA
jgi:hypothetical protein